MKVVVLVLLLLGCVWLTAKPNSKTTKIGIILTPGCRAADVIYFESYFRLDNKNEVYFIAENKGKLTCGAGFAIDANTTFENCPPLDVLFVGEMSPNEIRNEKVLNFIKQAAPKAKFIVGVSSGVESLYEAGLINQQKITADERTREKLKGLKLNVTDSENFVADGKLITARPSCGMLEAGTYVLGQLHGNWIAEFSELASEYRVPSLYNGEIVEKPTSGKALKVGIFVDKGVFLPDVLGAVDAFSFIPGVEFYYLAKDTSLSNAFMNKGASVYPNTKLKDAPNLDVLVVGASDPSYVKDHELSLFIIDQEPHLSAIISVCEGTYVVGATGLLEGKKVTTNYQQKFLLPKVGVKVPDNIIVNDGKFFSSGPAVGTYIVAVKAIEKIVSPQWAKYIEANKLEYDPKPIYKIEDPKEAPFSMRMASYIFFSLKLNPGLKKAIKDSYYVRTKSK
jgi:cyclohexyl-isocyanide hydratase